MTSDEREDNVWSSEWTAGDGHSESLSKSGLHTRGSSLVSSLASADVDDSANVRNATDPTPDETEREKESAEDPPVTHESEEPDSDTAIAQPDARAEAQTDNAESETTNADETEEHAVSDGKTPVPSLSESDVEATLNDGSLSDDRESVSTLHDKTKDTKATDQANEEKDVVQDSTEKSHKLQLSAPVEQLLASFTFTATKNRPAQSPSRLEALLNQGKARKNYNCLTRPTRQYIHVTDRPDSIPRWQTSEIKKDMGTILTHWRETDFKRARAGFKFKWKPQPPRIPSASLETPKPVAVLPMQTPDMPVVPPPKSPNSEHSIPDEPKSKPAEIGSPIEKLPSPSIPEPKHTPIPLSASTHKPTDQEPPQEHAEPMDDSWGDFVSISDSETSQPPAVLVKKPAISMVPLTPTSSLPSTPRTSTPVQANKANSPSPNLPDTATNKALPAIPPTSSRTASNNILDDFADFASPSPPAPTSSSASLLPPVTLGPHQPTAKSKEILEQETIANIVDKLPDLSFLLA